jgi:hypothetical protein
VLALYPMSGVITKDEHIDLLRSRFAQPETRRIPLRATACRLSRPRRARSKCCISSRSTTASSVASKISARKKKSIAEPVRVLRAHQVQYPISSALDFSSTFSH